MATALLITGMVLLVAEWIYSVLKDRKEASPADLPEERS